MGFPFRRLLLAAVLLATLVFSRAGAQDASIAGPLELYATFQSIGARLPYTGDANADAVAHVEWRESGSEEWNRGVDMVRITGQRWAGSLLFLARDTEYEVRAVIEDPDGGSSSVASARTRRNPVVTPSGRTLWVAVEGRDDASGTFDEPLATIQAAAERALPGDEIRVRRGVYYQKVAPTVSGTAENPIHLVADGPGVVLDGSDPALLHRADWRDDGEGVYSIPFESLTRLVCADSLQRLYHHEDLAALRSGAFGIEQGWTLEAGRLWLRLEDRSSPADHTMHIARYHVGIYLNGSHWRVSGFEIRYYGTDSSTGSGIALWGAHGCVLAGNYVHTIGGNSIFLRGQSADVLVEGNTCFDPRVSTWPWEAVKSHWEERNAISVRGGRGIVLRGNTARGTFDGIGASEEEAGENTAADLDIHDNLLTSIRDDAIESDVISAINIRIWKNRLEDVYVGISIAPIYQGPAYVLYNTIVDYGRSGFKLSLSSTGYALVCQNTVASSTTPSAAVHPSGPYSNLHFRNNILVGRGRSCVNDDGGESQEDNDFDGDLIYSYGASLFRWDGVGYSTIEALREATGFEVNGRSGDPRFTAPERGDYTLLPGSPAIDGGLRLPGINDAFAGEGPDMGAHEFGSETPVQTVSWSLSDETDALVLRWEVPGALSGGTYRIWRAGVAYMVDDSRPVPEARRIGPDFVGPIEPNGTTYEFRDVTADRGVLLAYWIEDETGEFGGPWIGMRSLDGALRLRALGNPFRDAARLEWSAPTGAHLSWRIYDIQGREVWSAAEPAGAGAGIRIWNAVDRSGHKVAPGIYCARLRTDSGAERTLKLLRVP